MSDEMDNVKWLREAPQPEWCGSALNKCADEIERLREENTRLREAVGLMTTMAPFMEIDVNDPVGMAKTVCAEQEKLFQENARLREALKPFAEKEYAYEGWADIARAEVWLNVRDIRAAAAAIREGGKE